MGSQELNHMNSLLLHLQEDNKSLREEMGRTHNQEKRILKLVNKNVRNADQEETFMHVKHAGSRYMTNVLGKPGRT